jgi:hypothetical protein
MVGTSTTCGGIKCDVTSIYTDAPQLTDAYPTGSAVAVKATVSTGKDASAQNPDKTILVVDGPLPNPKNTRPTIPVAVCANPLIKVEFNLEWKSFTWQTETGVQHTINRDKPCVVNGFSVSTNGGISHTYCPYKEGGTKVSYDITTLAKGVPWDTKSQTNPYLQAAPVVPVDTLKINLFTKRPPSPLTGIPKDACTPAAPVADRPNDLSIFLAGGWVGMEELAYCMKGNAGGTVLLKEFSHNFTPMCLQVQLSEAVVTIDGVRHTEGPTFISALNEHLDSGRIAPSQMRSMHNRSQVLVCGAKILGAATANKCGVRANSIGHLMYQPISLGLQQGEVIPCSMMGEMYKSYLDPVCPVMAVHFAAHAMNLCALPAWNADAGPPLLMGTNKNVACMTPRTFTTSQLVDLVHTTLQGPAYSAELVPYTSDMVLDISQNTVEKMRTGAFQGFEACDTKMSECIDSMNSVPNGLSCYRADDCEGSAAAIMMMQHNLRAAFYDGTQYLMNCNSDKGVKDMSKWIQSKNFCNVQLKPDEEYAFAVNTVVLSAVSHLAFDAKLLIIGAMCATPLVPIEQTQEQGHAASMGRVNMGAIADISAAVYSHYADPETRFTLLKLPPLQGVTAMGRPTDAKAVHLAGDYSMDVPSVTLTKPPTNFEGLPTVAAMPPGCHVLQSAFDQNYPCINVTPIQDENPCYQLLMIESTTSLHSCPVRGYVSAARMNALAATGSLHKPTMVLPQGVTPEMYFKSGVPVEQFLKAVQVGFIKPYLSVSEDVRLEGFSHSTNDASMPSTGAIKTPEFYHTFYQMDTFAFNTVKSDGSMLIGGDATEILNSSHCPTTCTTMEPITIPILTADENVDMKHAMMAQWSETRLPFIGMTALRNMLASWYPAKVNGDYYPDNEVDGIMRCNVAISGDNAAKLFADMNPGGAVYMERGVSNNGLIAQQHAIRMGRCTTIASQAIRTKHFPTTTPS